MSANARRGEVEIEFAGKTMTMRATFDCITRIEQQTGENIVPLLARIIRSDIGYKDAAIIISEGLRAGSEEGGVTLKAVGEEIFERGISEFVEPCVRLLHLGVGGPRTEADDPPMKATKAKS
jgi:hypothetical protein